MNIVATDGPLIAQYQAAMEQGNVSLANSILSQIPQNTQKIVRATDINKWTQAILALERFFSTDIEPYLEQQQQEWEAMINRFTYVGSWSSGTTYAVNNMVSYTANGVNRIYIATSTPPVGTVPTNTEYWRVLTIQGQTGPSGTGLAYRQEWDAGEQYAANEAVSYDGALWQSLQASQNIVPGTNNSYWQMIMTFDTTVYPIQDTEPTNIAPGSLWFNTSNNPTHYYYLAPLTNSATAAQITTGYQAYDANGNLITGTA